MYFRIYAKSSDNKFPSGVWTPGSCPAWICPSSYNSSYHNAPQSSTDAGGYFAIQV